MKAAWWVAALVAAACIAVAATPWAARAADSGPVPMRLLPTGDIGGLLVVELQLDGRSSRWLLDTGSSRHLVAPALVRRLGLATRGRVGADTAFGHVAGPEVTLPPMSLGALPIESTTAVVLDLRPLAGAAADDIDGVVGAPLLDEATLAFDFETQTLSGSTRPLTRCDTGMAELVVERRRGVPVLSLAVDRGAEERAIFDTGNAAALVRIDADEATARRGTPLPNVPAVVARAATVEWGPLVRREVPVAHLRTPTLRAALPADVGALAGVALFEGARLQLDLSRRRACVAPGERTVPGGFGFTLDRRGGSLVVSGVLDPSPARAGGLRAGDVVVSWAGAPAPSSVAEAWSRARASAELALSVERAGHLRALVLARAHFLPRLNP